MSGKAAVACLAMAVAAAAGAAQRDERPLQGLNWRVWLDERAEWQGDALFAPGEVPPLAALPTRPPSGGWEALSDHAGKACDIPASVEEYFSGGTNFWTYHGVSWFWCDVEAPSGWNGRRVRLEVEKARLRAEIYVNGRLAGYDIVAETPFELDVSEFLEYGKRNRIAFRLTNPGGQRGWADAPNINWGKFALPPGHDFTGLGHVKLVATDAVYVDDIFVKNLPPAKAGAIEVLATIRNTSTWAVQCTVSASIRGTRAEGRQVVDLKPGLNTMVFPFTVPEARLWEPDRPALYECTVALKGKTPKVADAGTVRFGFRVFEVKPGLSGGPNFYLNGRRFRFKSAIDWGYYALTGFYATPEMARKSVAAAKAIGQTGINFHRRIGEPLILQYADELGVCIYEEPGGFHADGGGIEDGTFTGKVMEEKCRRMALRDRNHPSLIINCLCNEDNNWNALREKVLRSLAAMDGSRLVLNTSGAEFTSKAEDRDGINHFRPYEAEMRRDFLDYHNACNIGARFNEGAVFHGLHRYDSADRAFYPGEVLSTTGPGNWFLCAEMRKALKPDRPGYDLNIQSGNRDKLAAAFRDWEMSGAGGGAVRGPADLSALAASGMFYMMGRHAQSILANNSAEGYALNGWSSGPQSTGGDLDWDSAMCDEGRNLKGLPEHFRWWVRPAQVAIFRKNGKYFNVGDTASFELNVINEGVIAAGGCVLRLRVTDGAGNVVAVPEELKLEVAGGDCFAQRLPNPLDVRMDEAWRGGYITLHAELVRKGKVLAQGAEQVLLANRPSFRGTFARLPAGRGAVCQWPEAKQALVEAGVTPGEFSADGSPAGLAFVAAGEVPQGAILDALLERVRRDGTLLLVQFSPAWADALLKKGLLSEAVTEWGGQQSPGWNGNGWGYLERFVGDQAVPGKTVIGTTGWEVPADPAGFYPFKSGKPMSVYGLYVARPQKFAHTAGNPDAEKRTLLVLVGALRHGKGRIILNAGYPVDSRQAFNDMVFYSMLGESIR